MTRKGLRWRARAELEEQQVRLRMADSQLKVAGRAVTDYLAAVGISSPDEVFRMLEAALDAAEDWEPPRSQRQAGVARCRFEARARVPGPGRKR